MENMVPLKTDLTKDSNNFDVVRGLETLIRVDKTIGIDPATTVTALFAEGQWAVLTDSGTLVPAVPTPNANTFPIFAGNANDRSDVHATGMATVCMGGRFIYKTKLYDTAPTYISGSPLTVKQTGGVDRVPTLASGTDPVLGRVVSPPDTSGVMEIEVVRP